MNKAIIASMGGCGIPARNLRYFLISRIAPWCLLAATAVLSGCASAGHSFNYQAAAGLQLGQLQAADYRATFGGKPTATSETTTADGKFEVARYTYGCADRGTARARAVILEFKDGKLNAFVYLSSFDKEQSQVAFDKISQLKSHVSTKADVLGILGAPNGRALCPSTLEDFKSKCDKGTEIWTWQELSAVSTFGAAYGGRRPDVKTIFISFDKDGVVSEIQTSNSSG